tara:strand:- start:91 stop:594 length:504 start_codon:yes stop_codon:yes gene_type:complete
MKIKYISYPGISYNQRKDLIEGMDDQTGIHCPHCEEQIGESEDDFELGGECPECDEEVDELCKYPLDEWFYDEDFIDTFLTWILKYDEETKTVSFISKDYTFKEYQEENKHLAYSNDKCEYDIEEKIRQFSDTFLGGWKEAYFEADDGTVIEPYEGEKKDDKELWNT